MRLLSDAEMEVVQKNFDWVSYKGKCPTCEGTGTYKSQGKTYQCPKSEYGEDAQFELFKHYCLAHVPIEQAKLSWDKFPQSKDLSKRIQRYIDTFQYQMTDGLGWTFAGKHGIGKTWAAGYILKELVKKGYSGYFLTFYDLKSIFEQEQSERWRLQKTVEGVSLLVIDDILKPMGERQGAFYQEQMESVLRNRSVYNRPTVVTTNLRDEEFDRYYPRVFSVLAGKQVYEEFEDTGDHRKELSKMAIERMEERANKEVNPLL